MLSLERQNELREEYRQMHPEWRPATEVFAEQVRNYLRPESRLLDLGCGRGGLVEQLTHPLQQMVGVDPDFVSLQEHRLRLSRVQAISQYLPFAEGTFDVAYSSWLLEHLEHPSAELQEVARILRPGGVFVFITPNALHPLATLNRLLGRLNRAQALLVGQLYGRAASDTFPTYYRANSQRQLEDLARRANCRLVTLHAIPDPTYLAFTPTLFRLAQALDRKLSPVRHLHLVGVLQRA